MVSIVGPSSSSSPGNITDNVTIDSDLRVVHAMVV
jgi:hypothetical protein